MFGKLIQRNKKKRLLSQFGQIGCNPTILLTSSIVGGNNIFIGDNFYSEDHVKLQTWEKYRGKATGFKPQLIIGNRVSMMSNCHISCLNSIVIGDDCLLGDNVFITDNFHGHIDSKTVLCTNPLDRSLYSKGPVKIGKNVWIGRNVCVMPNLEIGDGCVVGANSVVTHSFPNNCVIAGVPARIIRKY